MTSEQPTTAKALHETKIDAELKEFQAKIDLLMASAAKTSVEVRAVVARHMDELGEMKAALQERVEALKNSGEADWSRFCDELDATKQGLADKISKLADAISEPRAK